MKLRDILKAALAAPLLALPGAAKGEQPVQREHIPEDWSGWLIPPNFKANKSEYPVDFRFKAVGPGHDMARDCVYYRSGYRITDDMTVQEVADALIASGKALHRFVRVYEGGRRRTIAKPPEWMIGDEA